MEGERLCATGDPISPHSFVVPEIFIVKPPKESFGAVIITQKHLIQKVDFRYEYENVKNTKHYFRPGNA